MAFPVNFYSFTKEVNSTAQPSGSGTVYQCISNADFDIIAPRLPLNIGAAANPSGLNYCRVPAWSRYYWIRRWAFEGGLWVAYCQVDPLASWKTQIGQTSAYVLRSAAAWDSDLIDTLYPTDAGPTLSTQSADISSWWTDANLTYTSGNFIVGLINDKGSTEYVKMTPAQFTKFAEAAFSDTFYNGVATGQSWMTKAIFDPMQYLSSVTWYPIDMTGGTLTTAHLGYWEVIDDNNNPVSCYQVATYLDRTATVTVPKHPQAGTRGKWVNNAPYSSYILETWPFGRIALDPALLYDVTTITLVMTVDYISGSAILKVYQGSNDLTKPIIAQQTAQLGVQVQVSQVLRDYFGGAMGVINGVAGAVAGGLTGSATGLIGGITGAISSAVNAAYPDVTTQGHNSGFAGLHGSWRLYGKFYTLASEDIAHRGRPLYQVRQLSTLPGYQLCTDTDLRISCTKDEMDVIRGYLESGYYFE